MTIMAKQKNKVINISIAPTKFNFIFKKFQGEKSDFDFSDISLLRQVLSNEKAKILYTIKNQKPESLYLLAKTLKRNFKSVRDDVLDLERFGFIDLEKNSKGERKRIKPVLAVKSLQINFEL